MLLDSENLKKQFKSDSAVVESANDVETLRIKYLGKKGVLADLFKNLGGLPPAERPAAGKEINDIKTFLHSEIDQLKTRFSKTSASSSQAIDVTLPGNPPFVGYSHPLIDVLEEVKSIFVGMGFSVETGPEVESDYYNFEALNIPEDHPSRDMQDTFYLPNHSVLRTHTSPVQIRTMEKQKPPIRMIAPGRCFRKDTPDATHSPMFHQIEGLVVDEGVTFADLKGVLLAFMRKMFGDDTEIRFRPSFFPFTEPSAEYDVRCASLGGKWMEISGAGMVDPAVFNFVDYDSEKYTGYAFGMGLERLAILKYQVSDIRIFYENDLRFIQQF